jgi:hypothetical protein
MGSSKPANPQRAAALQPAGRLPDGGPQSAADGVVEAGKAPACGSPQAAAGRSRLPDGGQQGAADGVIEAGKPAAC